MFRRRSFMRLGLVAVTLGLLIFLSGSAFTRPWREGLAPRAGPILRAADRGTERFRGWLGGATRRRVEELEGERVSLLAEVASREALKRENEILREALALRGEGAEGVLVASALAFLREGRDEFILLDRGAVDGIGVGDIVINRERVLGGTIVNVSPHLSRAILLSSPSRSIEVVLPGRGLRAIARGNNLRELIVELVPQDAPIQSGDLILASPRASGGRAALLVAQVREVRPAEQEVFKTVRAIHLFDPADEAVIVLLAP